MKELQTIILATTLAITGLRDMATGLAAAAVRDATNGALSLYPPNPRYFQTAAGRPLLLIGDYTWGAFSDVDYDYETMFDTLAAHGLNFARVWLWWGCDQFPAPMNRRFVSPFQRPGPGRAHDGRPKYDLTRFNPIFFDRLKKFCAAARRRGIYLQLILFDAWMIKHPHLWRLHAFQRDNNINGVDGDPGRTGRGTDGARGFCSPANRPALEAQQGYIRRVVDAVSEFDNILWEIANENFYSEQWELELGRFLRRYELTKPKRHLVMPNDLPSHTSVVQTWNVNRIHAALLEKRRLGRPLIFDTDFTINRNDAEVRRAMWTAALSGGHFNYMDDSLQIGEEHHGDARGTRRIAFRRQIGYLAAFMRRMRFWEMEPIKEALPGDRAYALASRAEVAVYLPRGGRIRLDLSALPGALTARWFNPRAGSWNRPSAVAGGGAREFSAPDTQDWALFIQRGTNAQTASVPRHLKTIFRSPSSIWVSWMPAESDRNLSGYQIERNGQPLAVTVLPGYWDFGLKPGRRYAYTVAALDEAGHPSSRSPPLEVETLPRPASCSVRLGATNQSDGLRLVADRDGDTRPEVVEGQPCRRLAGADDRYFYFALDDEAAFNERGLTVFLEVIYFDAAGWIEPQFDSTGAAYKPAQRLRLTDTRQWKTHRWTLRACRFANRQNAGADFRLFAGPRGAAIASVRIEASPNQ